MFVYKRFYRECLEVTMDLMKTTQAESPSKVGELMCLFKGVHIDVSTSNSRRDHGLVNNVSSSNLVGSQHQSGPPARTVLNGEKCILQGFQIK